ncbi:MAG: ribonuclease domain-containing protein [Saprospiraceae bacterium]|nr:ribonuclease domain-containing protein [Saprospiraceae bacterium]
MQRPSPQKRLFARLIILAVLLVAAWFVWHRQQQTLQIGPPIEQSQTEQGQTRSTSTIPAYVLEVLYFIRQNGHAPDGYVGGREFQNREKHLPAKDSWNKRIRYSEWDVRPKVQGQNRGPERLVTGSDHSAYYSRDHYKTFLKIE